MKRLLVLPVLVVVLLVAAGAAFAEDAKGPSCVEIIDTDWGYSADGTTATAIIFVEAASCPSTGYTVVAQDSLTETAIVGTQTVRGDGNADDTSGPGTDSVTVTAALSEQDGTVCLYATTAKGAHVFDRAPNAGASPDCVALTPGGTPSGSGFE